MLIDKDSKEEKEPFLKRTLKKANTTLSLGYFYGFFRAIQLQVIIGAMVSLVSADTASTSGQVDILIGIIILLFYIVLTGFVYWVIRYKIKRLTLPWKHHQDSDYENLITDSKLFKELKPVDKTNLGVFYTLIVDLMHDFFLPIFLIFFVKSPYIQLILATLTTGATGWFYISTRPYKSKFVGILKSGNKCIYFTILLAFLLRNIVDGKISRSQSFTYFGFGVIGLISILLAFNVIVMLTSTLAGLCSRKKSKDKNSPEVIAPRVDLVADVNAEGIRARIDSAHASQSSNQSSLNLLEREAVDDQPRFQFPPRPNLQDIFADSPGESSNLSRGSVRSQRRQESPLEGSDNQERSIDIRSRKKRRGSRMNRRRSFHNTMQKSLHKRKEKKSRFGKEKQRMLERGNTPKKSNKKHKNKKSKFRGEKQKDRRKSSKNPNIEPVGNSHRIEEIQI